MKYLSLLSILLICFLSYTPSFAEPQITYFVINCNDGNTCRLRSSDNINVKIRLTGIDAPEVANAQNKTGQPFSNQSKDYLNTIIKGKVVVLKSYSQDHYGRNLSEIFIDKINVNIKMLEEGMAEIYQGKLDSDLQIEKYSEAEKKAQALKRGIWSLSSYQSPSKWRKYHKK